MLTYKERIECLNDSLKAAQLSNVEIHMIHGILDLSKERNKFNREYNTKIDNILRDKKRTDD